MAHTHGTAVAPLETSPQHRQRSHGTPGTPTELPQVPSRTMSGELRRWMLTARKVGVSKARVLRILDWARQQADVIWS